MPTFRGKTGSDVYQNNVAENKRKHYINLRGLKTKTCFSKANKINLKQKQNYCARLQLYYLFADPLPWSTPAWAIFFCFFLGNLQTRNEPSWAWPAGCFPLSVCFTKWWRFLVLVLGGGKTNSQKQANVFWRSDSWGVYRIQMRSTQWFSGCVNMWSDAGLGSKRQAAKTHKSHRRYHDQKRCTKEMAKMPLKLFSRWLWQALKLGRTNKKHNKQAMQNDSFLDLFHILSAWALAFRSCVHSECSKAHGQRIGRVSQSLVHHATAKQMCRCGGGLARKSNDERKMPKRRPFLTSKGWKWEQRHTNIKKHRKKNILSALPKTRCKSQTLTQAGLAAYCYICLTKAAATARTNLWWPRSTTQEPEKLVSVSVAVQSSRSQLVKTKT